MNAEFNLTAEIPSLPVLRSQPGLGRSVQEAFNTAALVERQRDLFKLVGERCTCAGGPQHCETIFVF